MADISIVGAGILGLAHAYTYASRGHRVRVFERSPRAEGASIRNFGMIWPIGQPAGAMHDMALRSRALWLTVLDQAGLPYQPNGSLHLAYFDDEEALARLPAFLAERYGVEFHWRYAVRNVADLRADRVFICSGHDFETLYPELFAGSGLTRCKLQMLRTVPQPNSWRLGPALAAGLTMRFYSSFANCPSMATLRRRFDETMPAYGRWGIHVMASQAADGAITLGDSHEYGLALSIFNREEIDDLILAYLDRFARFPDRSIAERWHGIYAKHPDKPYCVFHPEPAVRIVTGLGGAGMTLSFGLADTLYEA